MLAVIARHQMICLATVPEGHKEGLVVLKCLLNYGIGNILFFKKCLTYGGPNLDYAMHSSM
jgi:hypothetical protein